VRGRIAVLISIGMLAVFLAPVLLPTSVGAGPGRTFVIGAVGDIATTLFPHNNPSRNQYDDVSELASSLGLTRLLVLGDAQHEYGLYDDYLTYYDPYFGRLLDITSPVPGNHDYYYWDDARGYFEYFGEIARGPLGFYSFNLGSWHIIALNSQLCRIGDGCGPGTPQYVWLETDLQNHPNERYPGTIAFMHHPLFDWEPYSSASWFTWWDLEPQKPMWDLLYQYGADLVLVGHNHNYQRWAPQDPEGNSAPGGIREFVVGTGGAYLSDLGHPPRPANLEVAQDTSFGILRLTLYRGGYDFEFISIAGEILDAGYGVPVH